MRISAHVLDNSNGHDVTVRTNGRNQSLNISRKANGQGSNVNGGELLMLALATCFCNDLYREAAKRHIRIEGVDVFAEGDFGAEGTPGKNIVYRARVQSPANHRELRDLLAHTDAVAEIHNTLRAGTAVTLEYTDP